MTKESVIKELQELGFSLGFSEGGDIDRDFCYYVNGPHDKILFRGMSHDMFLWTFMYSKGYLYYWGKCVFNHEWIRTDITDIATLLVLYK